MDDIRNIYKEKEYKILFKEFYPSLVQFAFHYINNHEAAEDIVQEIFVYLWEKQIHFENELIIRTYLYRSVRNKCFTYLRNLKIQQHHEREITNNWQEQEEPIVLNNLIQEEVYRQLLASIDELPPQCKKICMLTLEGKKPSEIAGELGLAVDTVKKQKQIALKRLQDKLGILFLLYPMLYTHFTS